MCVHAHTPTPMHTNTPYYIRTIRTLFVIEHFVLCCKFNLLSPLYCPCVYFYPLSHPLLITLFCWIFCINLIFETTIIKLKPQNCICFFFMSRKSICIQTHFTMHKHIHKAIMLKKWKTRLKKNHSKRRRGGIPNSKI